MTVGTKIKICGIRRDEDCIYINEAMPDYAGFIFWNKSFRYVDKENAARLRQLIDPKIAAVGVFVNEEAERIADIAASGTINAVQLHGTENEQYVSKLRSLLPPDTEIWKAFKIRSIDDIRAAMSFDADRILLDNGYGTGQSFDHGLLDAAGSAADDAELPADAGNAAHAVSTAEPHEENITSEADSSDAGKCAAHVQRRKIKHNEYILAGGLTPENIGEAIAKYHPYMIDISSGVETDGCKDRDKIMRAVAACRKEKKCQRADLVYTEDSISPKH